jgi:hypothetical protein
MANTTKAIPQKEEVREKGSETPDAPLLMLDFSDAAVKKMIKQAIQHEGHRRPTCRGVCREK